MIWRVIFPQKFSIKIDGIWHDFILVKKSHFTLPNMPFFSHYQTFFFFVLKGKHVMLYKMKSLSIVFESFWAWKRKYFNLYSSFILNKKIQFTVISIYIISIEINWTLQGIHFEQNK